jgi:carboxypeptidase D
LSIWTAVLALVSFVTAAAAAEKTQSDYFVHSLPGQPDGPLLKMHAGYVLSFRVHPPN